MSEGEITGRLFLPEAASGVPCTVVAVTAGLQASADGASCLLPFAAAQLSFGGHSRSMLVVEQQTPAGKLTLYAPRADVLPALRELGDPEIDLQLDGLLQGERGDRFGGWRNVLIGLGVIFFLGWGTLIGVDAVIDWGIDKVPPAWEVELGKQLVTVVTQDMPKVTDPTVVQGIEAITQRLLAKVDTQGFEFVLHVVDDPMVNAFTLPGGQIVVTTGIIGDCETPEELAGVLAHELQHALHRHGLRRLAESMKWRVALSMVVGNQDWLMQLVLRRAGDMLVLAHSRDEEREADRDGLELLRKADIDPQGLVSFFTRLMKEHEEHETGAVQVLFQTHPATSERIAYLQQMITDGGGGQTTPIDVDWFAVQTAAR